MKKEKQIGPFFFRLMGFLAPLLVVFMLYNRTTKKIVSLYKGPTIEQQIAKSFHNAEVRDYEVLILGNSRLYRGLNPERFSLPTFNFGHDNDRYNQMYYKLQYLHKRGVSFRYLIVGVDYFAFSEMVDYRNYVYKKYLDEAYMDDYTFKLSSLKVDDEAYNEYMVNRFTRTLPIVLGHLWRKARGMEMEPIANFLKENGQYIINPPTKAKEDDFRERKFNRLEKQKMYFDKILSFAKANGIRVCMVMPPTRENELSNYSVETIEQYESFFEERAKDPNVTYLNYSRNPEFELNDFMDITHLNPNAADRFSDLVNKSLIENHDI